MALDPSYAGRSYPPTPSYRVGREKIGEFADAIGATEAAYRDAAVATALGYADVIAPATFPIVLAAAGLRQLVDDPGLGLDFSRVLHAEQRFAYRRPVQSGDRLHCVLTIEEITSRAGNDFITARTEVTTDEGEPVVTAWNKLVVRGTQ